MSSESVNSFPTYIISKDTIHEYEQTYSYDGRIIGIYEHIYGDCVIRLYYKYGSFNIINTRTGETSSTYTCNSNIWSLKGRTIYVVRDNKLFSYSEEGEKIEVELPKEYNIKSIVYVHDDEFIFMIKKKRICKLLHVSKCGTYYKGCCVDDAFLDIIKVGDKFYTNCPLNDTIVEMNSMLEYTGGRISFDTDVKLTSGQSLRFDHIEFFDNTVVYCNKSTTAIFDLEYAIKHLSNNNSDMQHIPLVVCENNMKYDIQLKCCDGYFMFETKDEGIINVHITKLPDKIKSARN